MGLECPTGGGDSSYWIAAIFSITWDSFPQAAVNETVGLQAIGDPGGPWLGGASLADFGFTDVAGAVGRAIRFDRATDTSVYEIGIINTILEFTPPSSNPPPLIALNRGGVTVDEHRWLPNNFNASPGSAVICSLAHRSMYRPAQNDTFEFTLNRVDEFAASATTVRTQGALYIAENRPRSGSTAPAW